MQIGESSPGGGARVAASHACEPLATNPSPDPGRPLCALTVDVEDWYQSCVDLEAPITERVVRNVSRMLELLDACRVKATFFVQGRVAETFPGLLQGLLAEGHEIQSHGYSHRPLASLGPRALADELDRGMRAVEDACGVRPTAFRAADFSIGANNLSALEALVEAGFVIDSSIFPLAMRRYGIRGWELGPHWIALGSGARILEVPVAVWTIGRLRVPVGGGGYFRLAPRSVLDRALRSIVASQRPAVVYCHPYEFNANELNEYRGLLPTRFRLSQGVGRRAFVERLGWLLQRLPFGRLDEVLAAWEAQPSATSSSSQ